MTKLLKHFKPYTLALIAIVALTYVQAMANLQLPDYMSKIVNEGIVGKNMDVIWQTGGMMLLVTFVGGVATVIASLFSAQVGSGVSRNLREKIFTKVESYSLTEFDKFSTASLITRTTNDIQQIQMVTIMILRMAISAPITGIGAIINALNKDVSMSWIIALAVAILIGVMTVAFVAALPKFKILQKLVDRLNLVTRENLTGLRVIRAFNAGKYEEDKFDKANTDFTKVNLFVNRLMVIMMPFMTLLLSITSVAVIWFGAQAINDGTLLIGDMMAFMQYAIQVIFSFLFLTIIFIMIPRASVSAQRIAEVLETEPSIKDPEQPKTTPTDIKGVVEFKDVSFSYPSAETPALQNISFTAKPGEMTAFVGSTGSGKTTLINLIPRFYDITSGQILVDGIDIREMTMKDLREKIGYVPQKGILFSGTVAENIRYGKQDATEDEVKFAAVIAQAAEFVEKSEEKYEMPIAQAGANVSGGQKQRLSIARALVKKPEIYIFDDSFSALDFKTDAALRKELEKETENSTVLIVAQRLGTIMNANQIIVLEDGKISGIGTHRDLLKSNDVYREIALSQLSEEELA